MKSKRTRNFKEKRTEECGLIHRKELTEFQNGYSFHENVQLYVMCAVTSVKYLSYPMN